MRIFVRWIAVASLLVGGGIHAQIFSKAAPVEQKPIPVLTPPPPGFSYPAKQTLTFSVDWRVFTAGTAVFHLEQVGDALKITATADTSGAVNMLFPVIDRFQSGFDTKTGCSSGFSKQIQEGRRKISSELTFDYARGKQNQYEKNLVKGTATQKEANVPACVTDSLSAFFMCGLAASGGGSDSGVSTGGFDADGHRQYENLKPRKRSKHLRGRSIR